MLFYILVIFVIGMFILYIVDLLVSDDVWVSLFILIFEWVGLVFVVLVINVVILIVVLFVGNLGMYVFMCMLWNLVKDGKVLRFLVKVNKWGVLVNVLIVMVFVGIFVFGVLFFGDGVVYMWLFNVSGMSGFIVWLGIVISYYCFRRVFVV